MLKCTSETSHRHSRIEPSEALNAVCPYYTMFPLEFPLCILERYPEKLRVLDPFCGRGTTIFAARLKGHDSYGMDCSPIAIAIARAKLAETTDAEVLALTEGILRDRTNVTVPEGEFWRWAYAPSTLLRGLDRIVFEASETEHRWAPKELNPELPSDWSGYRYLVFELRASTPQRFEVRIHTPNGVRTVWMHPFAGVWIRTALPIATLARSEQSAVDLAAMSNKRRALSFFTGAHGQGPLNQVQGIGVRMPSPVGAAALELRTVRLAKEDPGDALLESGPLVDQFGRWMPAEWPGKARDATQLRSEWTEESKALRPSSFGFDKYGGCAATQARATGFFRVEQIDGRWWFVDPDGHLFLSTGADATRWAIETTTLNRRGIFEALPPAELNRLSSRGEDRQMVSFYTWNLLRIDSAVTGRSSGPIPH